MPSPVPWQRELSDWPGSDLSTVHGSGWGYRHCVRECNFAVFWGKLCVGRWGGTGFPAICRKNVHWKTQPSHLKEDCSTAPPQHGLHPRAYKAGHGHHQQWRKAGLLQDQFLHLPGVNNKEHPEQGGDQAESSECDYVVEVDTPHVDTLSFLIFHFKFLIQEIAPMLDCWRHVIYHTGW